jgi:hypothetical protein
VTYKPPILPVRLVIDPSGVSIEGDASIVTPIGTFSVGASVPLVESNEIMVILRDRNRGKDEAYRVHSGRNVSVLTNGRTAITIGADGVVVVDVTDGQVQTVEIREPSAHGDSGGYTAVPIPAPTAKSRDKSIPSEKTITPSPKPTNRPVSTCIEGRLHTENISSPLSEVRGRVVTADGQPVAGARLRNVVPGYEDKYCPETVTDSSGGYNFASLNPQPYRVTLLSPGDGQTHVDFTVTEYGHRYVVEFIVGDCGN